MTNITSTPVTIGGQEYLIQDINLRTAKKIFPYMKALSNPEHSNYMDAMGKVITFCLQQMDPQITEDFVVDNMQFCELSDVMEMISAQLTKKKQMKPAMSNPSTGESYTQESLQPQDGPGNT